MSDINELNQRILYAGLSRMSQNRSEIQAGFQRWQQALSSQPFDIFNIVADLVDHLGLNVSEKKALMIGMHSASNKLLDELTPVPPVLLQSAGESEPVSQTDEVQEIINTKPAHIQITDRFFQLIGQYITRNNRTATAELADIIEEEGLPSASGSAEKAVDAWANNGCGQMDLAKDVDVSMCQSLSHDLYVLMTEVIGPVDSDVIVNRAIDDLLKTEEAQKFNPRDLL